MTLHFPPLLIPDYRMNLVIFLNFWRNFLYNKYSNLALKFLLGVAKSHIQLIIQPFPQQTQEQVIWVPRTCAALNIGRAPTASEKTKLEIYCYTKNVLATNSFIRINPSCPKQHSKRKFQKAPFLAAAGCPWPSPPTSCKISTS